MKNALKLIALLLAVMMVALPLVACENKPEPTSGETSGKTSGKTSGEPASDEPNVPTDGRFDGETIRFYINAGDSDAGSEESLQIRSICLDEDADMAYNINQAVATRNQTVQDKLGVTIELTGSCGMQAAGTELQPILLGGSDEFDVFGAYQYFDMGLAIGETAGTFLNYKKIADDEMFIDPTKPYWDTDCFEELAYQGAAYWLTGDLSETWVSTMFVTFVNANLWKQYAETIKGLCGYDDIYELVYAGEWTLDLWSKISQAVYVDTNSDDKIDYLDTLGYISYNEQLNNIMVDGLAAGSHVTYSEKVDGVPTINFYNDHSVAFADALYKLYKESKACLIPWLDEYYIMDIFAMGNVLMCVQNLAAAESYLADMTDDYYIVPVPKLNKEQANYATTIGDCVSQYGIPVTCPHVGATTATLELMAYYSKKLVTPAYYDVALKERYTRDEKAAAMIDFIHDTTYSDFAMLWSNELSNVTWFFRTNITKRFASSAKTQQKKWTNALEKLLEKLETSTYIEN